MERERCSENELEFSGSVLLAFSVTCYSSHFDRNLVKSSPSVLFSSFRSCLSLRYREILSFPLFYFLPRIYARIRLLYYSFLFSIPLALSVCYSFRRAQSGTVLSLSMSDHRRSYVVSFHSFTRYLYLKYVWLSCLSFLLYLVFWSGQIVT